MKAHQTTDKQLCTVFGGFGQGLVEEEGIANRAVEHAVQDMREGLALRSWRKEFST